MTVAVKPLEWGALVTDEWDANGVAVRVAQSPIGEYRIRSIPRQCAHWWADPFGQGGCRDNYSDCKADAQESYEQRILSALHKMEGQD